MRYTAEYQEPNLFEIPALHELSNIIQGNRVENANGEVITFIRLCYGCHENSRTLEVGDEVFEVLKSLIGRWILVEDRGDSLSVIEFNPEEGWKTE